MKEKFDLFMQKGGFSVIVAVVCMSLYLGVMSTAQKCSADSLEPIEIKLTDDGNLYLNYIYDDKDDLMVLWETDGGTIKPSKENSDLKEQYTEDNKWYYAYGTLDDEFVWDSKDADGNDYEIATVKATLYEKTKDKSLYFIDEAEVEVTMTVTIKDGKVVEVDDRFFSNPVRSGNDDDWSQIYLINEGEKVNTYRYRTGKDIPDEEYLFLRWESSESIICETDLRNGLIPNCGVINSNKNKDMLVQINTISIFNDSHKGEIEAYIVNDKHYEDSTVDEDNKINKAVLSFN